MIKNLDIPVQVQTLKKALGGAFEEFRRKYDLTMNEIIVLLYLLKNKEKNTAKDIVEDTMITKSHISKSVETLVKKNIITRFQDSDDKKIIHLQIIDKNTNFIEELKEKNDEINKKITEGITSEELIILENTFNKIKENIRKININ